MFLFIFYFDSYFVLLIYPYIQSCSSRLIFFKIINTSNKRIQLKELEWDLELRTELRNGYFFMEMDNDDNSTLISQNGPRFGSQVEWVTSFL